MDKSAARQSAAPCPGIEIEPGHFSGCTAAQTGATDCPVCTPDGAAVVATRTGTPKATMAQAVDKRIGKGL